MAGRTRRRVKARTKSKPLTLFVFDLGAKCGWATYRNGKFASGTYKLVKASNKKHQERPGMRFARFWYEMNIMGLLGKPDAVYYEEVHAHAGTDAAHAYGGFRAQLMFWCENYPLSQNESIASKSYDGPVPYGSFGVGTIKKRATGRGNAKKPEMVAAANETFGPILGREITDDNEADALWILALALEKHGIEWKALDD